MQAPADLDAGRPTDRSRRYRLSCARSGSSAVLLVFSLAAIAALREIGERIAAKQADHRRSEPHVVRMTYQPFPEHRSLVSLSPSAGIRSCRNRAGRSWSW